MGDGRCKMSDVVIIRAEEVERFAHRLKAFNAQLQDNLRVLNADFGRLSESWRDPANERFAHQFHETVTVLRQFVRISDEYIPFLLQKAEKARNVHS